MTTSTDPKVIVFSSLFGGAGVFHPLLPDSFLGALWRRRLQHLIAVCTASTMSPLDRRHDDIRRLFHDTFLNAFLWHELHGRDFLHAFFNQRSPHLLRLHPIMALSLFVFHRFLRSLVHLFRLVHHMFHLVQHILIFFSEDPKSQVHVPHLPLPSTSGFQRIFYPRHPHPPPRAQYTFQFHRICLFALHTYFPRAPSHFFCTSCPDLIGIFENSRTDQDVHRNYFRRPNSSWTFRRTCRCNFSQGVLDHTPISRSVGRVSREVPNGKSSETAAPSNTAAIHAQHAIYVRVDVVACLLLDSDMSTGA